MGSVVEQVGESIVKEAVGELVGRSKQKWGLIVLAFVLGGLVAVAVFKARQRSATEDGSTPTP